MENSAPGTARFHLAKARPGDLIGHRDAKYRVLEVSREGKLVNVTLQSMDGEWEATLTGLPSARVTLEPPLTKPGRKGVPG